MKPRLAVVTEFSEPYYAGGGERRYFEYAKRLVNDFDVTWISMRQLDSPHMETIAGIRFVHLGPRIKSPPHRSFSAFLRFELALIWHLWTHAYDVVDAQPFSPLLGSFLGTLFRKSQLVATIYDISSSGDDQFVQYSRVGRLMENLLYRLPYRRIVTLSDAVKEALKSRFGVPEGRIQVVHCGVSLESVDAVSPQEKIRDLVLVARLVPSKRLGDFLKVCKKLGATGAIIGQGPLAAEIAEQIGRMGLERQVTLLGKLDEHADVLKEIKKSRVLVLPSAREGFGIVLAEAGACGVPVVAYASGGVVDVVEHSRTGFLAKTGDVVELAAQVNRLLQSKELRDTMGNAGRMRVESLFTWDATVKELEKAYR